MSNIKNQSAKSNALNYVDV